MAIDAGGGLIQQQHAWCRDQCASERQQLALARGETEAALAQQGVEPQRQTIDQRRQMRFVQDP